MLMPKFSQGDLLPEKNIDKDEYNIIDIGIYIYENSFQPGSFWRHYIGGFESNLNKD